MRTRLHTVGFCVSVAWLRAPAEELRSVGSLGNSGGDGASAVVFADRPAPGMGPALDDDGTIWERGGAGRLNRYAPDGRLLASFEIPEDAGEGDQLTRVGRLLVLKLGRSVFTLRTDAPAGAKPDRRIAEADVLSSGAFEGRPAVLSGGALAWLDPATGAKTEFARPGGAVSALCVTEDGTVHAFGAGQVAAWRGGTPVDGFPKPFNGDRPQKIGAWWFSHAWHGTIHRYNSGFEPSPGVVLAEPPGPSSAIFPRVRTSRRAAEWCRSAAISSRSRGSTASCSCSSGMQWSNAS